MERTTMTLWMMKNTCFLESHRSHVRARVGLARFFLIFCFLLRLASWLSSTITSRRVESQLNSLPFLLPSTTPTPSPFTSLPLSFLLFFPLSSLTSHANRVSKGEKSYSGLTSSLPSPSPSPSSWTTKFSSAQPLILFPSNSLFPTTTMSSPAQLDTSNREMTINLGAGPSCLPTEVLLQAAQGIIDYERTGMGLVELSHRSSTFIKVVKSAEADLRQLLAIPEDYAVLFQQGGGTEQFTATALNLLAAHAVKNPDYMSQNPRGPPCDYAITGSWTSKALKEAKRMGANVNVVVDSRKEQGADSKFGCIPPVSTWKLSPVESKPAFLYYCDNETVEGVEFPSPGLAFDQLPEEYRKTVPIVADCSSNILSRPIDVKAHSIIFFGAQKNVGPSGVTIVIVRKDLIVDPDQGVPNGGPRVPTTLVYKNAADNGSLYNTPPTFAIYATGLVLRDLLENKGGVQGAAQRSENKSRAVYQTIASSNGIFVPSVRQQEVRSRMNITFRVCRPGGPPDEELEERFVKKCSEKGITQVKGHRSVGGIRTSLYNAITEEQTQVLVQVMKTFIDEISEEAK
ncbi:PLP-dependent transferase [Violaceomyces palustris]|uniref:PLP-dependent transferase n=1 Tax=Violaceomyces palustris TaxID=1673888 RepID=A0ACD0P0E8_9BASI|nr:PLP-dependent transferase [Violaceomyces palustris]